MSQHAIEPTKWAAQHFRVNFDHIGVQREADIDFCHATVGVSLLANSLVGRFPAFPRGCLTAEVTFCRSGGVPRADLRQH